ncbi:mediator of RNA polymerase II transcription subunit 27 isoform X2 [Phyllopteryx taeniolatus]|uniref:mediator of RNA polymerase II transcription subunit 27 isoform X2 n=1 Tax=Phyllopteryx taeniolatus TaxID=161469 RepID=UPI002AD3D705|nr:mediator of RNA polymerase II transcription subunit 27 isoform X2 [Phyllopteryx taeniolatus]
MADVVSVGVNLDAFSHAISGIQALRSSVSRVFECLKDGMKNRETLEGREKQFIATFQDNLQAVNRDLNELERLSGLVGRPSESHPLHNSGLLSLDPVQDKTPLYSQLLQAYKWSNKLQYHAGLASSLLNQQSLKRSANQMGASAKRRPKVQPSTLVLPPQYVDDVISRIGRMFPDMSIELFRPNGTSAVLLVTLGKVLKAIVVMRSLFIDRTLVRGFNENVYDDDGKLDIWTKSQHQVFQKVSLEPAAACRFPERGSSLVVRSLGNGPRHHRPAALPTAADARRGRALLHDLAEELHQTVPVSVPAMRPLPAGRTSSNLEGL